MWLPLKKAAEWQINRRATHGLPNLLETTYDLMPFRGQRIYVHFEVRNDGDATASWMYVDDVSVNICR